MPQDQVPPRSSRDVEDYQSPFTGEGIDLSAISSAGLEIRPVPLSAGILPRNSPWKFEHVFSPFCRLYFATHDKMYIRTEKTTIRVPKNGFLLIPSELHFHCNTTGWADHVWIHFTLEPPWLESFREPIPIPGDATSRALARGVRKVLEGSPASHTAIHQLKSLLHLLLSGLSLAEAPEFPTQLQKALQIAREEIHRPLPVKELARRVGYSPEHLSHLFRKHFDKSPRALIRENRIHEAARRLAYSDDTIEAIADDLCFANRHHLSRVFKTVVNESPAAFRRRIKEG